MTNNTFQDFLNTYAELKGQLYTIFETKDPDAYTVSDDLEIKLLEFLNHTFIPYVESNPNPELFFERLKSLSYGENKPLLLNYLRKFGLLKSLTDSTKVDSGTIQEAKNKIQYQIQEFQNKIYKFDKSQNVSELIRNHHIHQEHQRRHKLS